MKTKISLIVLLPFILFLTGCGSSLELQSNRIEKELPMDINNSTWQKGLTRLGDEPVYFNSLNDNEYLYLYITTADQVYEQQFFGRGLTVWFDSTGGDAKIFGIGYPIGVRDPDFMKQQFDMNKRDMPDREAMIQRSLQELEIIGPMENATFQTTPDGSKGVIAKIERTNGNFTYMLKVPFYKNADHYFAIGTSPGKKLGFGIVLNEPNFNRDGMRKDRSGISGGFRPPEGGDEGTEMPGGRRGGRSGFGNREQMKNLEVWGVLNLAK